MTGSYPVVRPEHRLRAQGPFAGLSCHSEEAEREIAYLRRHNSTMRRLVNAVQELSLARSIETVMTLVRTAAREMTGADGATFILRDGDKCHYAEESAIAPLWKGQRFPMSACISGWAMLNRQCVVIEDIYEDPRIPVDAYRPTFVKSLIMVPIRPQDPLGAIGIYWAQHHLGTPDEVETLQALANTTAVAMEGIKLYDEMEQRVKERTLALEAANQELEAFSYSASHDLQGPIRRIMCFIGHLTDRCGDSLDPQSKEDFRTISRQAGQMSALVNDLLKMARLARTEMYFERVDLSSIAHEVAANLRRNEPTRHAQIIIQDDLVVCGHSNLLKNVLQNLLSNAWKYTSRLNEPARIEFGKAGQPGGSSAFFVRDNGTGFDPAYARKLFIPFQRLHNASEFPGSGVGLATVRRIIERHGGRIWAEAKVHQGATFFFTLPSHDQLQSSAQASAEVQRSPIT
ncbi:MAG: histidine kinase [Verrucomicrobia bacterium]|nr:MAG: histidine kinase [Verrucomicrobiota bacterium]